MKQYLAVMSSFIAIFLVSLFIVNMISTLFMPTMVSDPWAAAGQNEATLVIYSGFTTIPVLISGMIALSVSYILFRRFAVSA
ncbi:hypothetical protein ACFOU0_08190 [Salinicoccus sesuvii]|uniref:Uncharacterized protein n=1 Tax=Salinicoccus sesuvii TaxID=868281 RepID=A0ABV7N7J0_9STAP